MICCYSIDKIFVTIKFLSPIDLASFKSLQFEPSVAAELGPVVDGIHSVAFPTRSDLGSCSSLYYKLKIRLL